MIIKYTYNGTFFFHCRQLLSLSEKRKCVAVEVIPMFHESKGYRIPNSLLFEHKKVISQIDLTLEKMLHVLRIFLVITIQFNLIQLQFFQ